MVHSSYGTVTRNNPLQAVLETNKVIRNTYILLSLTLLFSAFTAWMAMVTRAQPVGLLSIVIYFGLLFTTSLLRNSVWGLVSIFALTGFLGYTLGPILNFYIGSFSNGNQLVMSALGTTGLLFLGLSGYALSTRKDFNYLGGFLFIGMIAVMLASIVGLFLPIPTLYLIIAAASVLLMSGMILFETSQIIQGGERNYIMATITLYVAIYNMFISLLQIFAHFAGRRE